MKLKNINEQIIVVQGASSGIGRATAKLLARNGAKLIVSARGEKGLKSLVEEIENEGGTAKFCIADVLNIDEIKALGTFAITEYGKIDTWISTAGSWVTAKFEDHTPEEFQRVIDVNLMGMAKTLWTALPHLKSNISQGAEGTSLILVSSMLGQMALPYSSSYNAAKFGMQGMINALRIELLQENVPINLVNIMPYGTNTPIYNTGLSKIGSVPKPAPPIVNPELVAQLIAFAATNPSRDLYGSTHAFIFDKAYQLFPDLVDKVLAVASTKEAQSTQKSRRHDENNNLFSVVEDFRIQGDYLNESISEDVFISMQTLQKNQKDDFQNLLKNTLPMLKNSLLEIGNNDGSKIQRKATLKYLKIVSKILKAK
ncbi:SDR family NAD(P)-dependent oxidoreductase [Flavobacterium sp.]|uniref:SDR family NAD(P)-dependent oxidoreductase n=1 Tax=Flavobacterium sp. TaxID=239 RepID=UPI002606AA74|nr:SDR family NAD(P)-dependent oxidoreductase [Flavobacterium sp.]